MVKNTMENMEEMREQTVKNTEQVVLLGEKIAQIHNIIKIINTLADQTKLIAFNASIEAAGAGEAGSRFSIVAAEVRRLADTVVESVGEISSSVLSIQNATNELILSSETGMRKVNQGAMLIAESGQAIQQMTALLENITTSAREISRSMQHQFTENGKMVLQGIQEISDKTEQVIETHQKAHETARELHALAKELDETVHQVRI
jgi:methyl-accepting chemotaxis protein